MKISNHETPREPAARLVNISIAEGKTGMFFATCESEPTFFISATSLPNLWAAIPCALEYMYSSKYRLEMKAIPIDQGNFHSKPWALVPRGLLEQKAAEQSFQLESDDHLQLETLAR